MLDPRGVLIKKMDVVISLVGGLEWAYIYRPILQKQITRLSEETCIQILKVLRE